MRKFLLVLSSITITFNSVIIVSACGYREPVNVILELPANVTKSSAPIIKAYREIVVDYNYARPNNPIKVEAKESAANNIDNEIATGQPLPNLYVSYADSVTKNETILHLLDEDYKIVNLAQAINWDPKYVDQIDVEKEPRLAFIKEYRDNATKGNELTKGKSLDEITHADSNSEKDHFTPLRDSFPREGNNNDKMYVVPTAKSGMTGVMNTRLINELVKLVSGIELSFNDTEIRTDGHFFKDGGADWNRVNDEPLKELKDEFHLPLSNLFRDEERNISELFKDWFNKDKMKSIQDLQAVMQDLSKLEVIVLAYVKLVESSSNRNYFKAQFSIAIDDVPGLIYTMQANLGFPDEQMYSWTNEKPYRLTLYQRKPNSNSLTDTIEFFAWADQLRPLNNDSGNNPDHGYGGVTAKVNNSTAILYTDFWQKQGMLAYFGSTSGAAYWVKDNPVGEDLYVQPVDVQLLNAPSYYPKEGQNFVDQQGPGMAMFKSNNQVKNEIAIDFLNYFLKTENNVKFAIAAGYIPANYYAYYAQKQEEDGPPPDNNLGIYYQLLKQESSEIKGAKIVKKYVDSILRNDLQLWTQIPTPFGDAMRFQVLIPWFEANFKTNQNHHLTFEDFWKELKDKTSIANIDRIVHGLYPIDGDYEIKQNKERLKKWV